MYSYKKVIYIFIVLFFYDPVFAFDLKKIENTRQYTYRIINTYPHNPCSWTQGLVFNNNFIYESTGRYGHSCLLKVDLLTGKSVQVKRLNRKYYGEGLTLLNNKLIQLTWQSRTGFIYNNDFSLVNTFSYPFQGWGITTDGSDLIMSDGSSVLYFIKPDTFEQVRKIRVSDKGCFVKRLNELEYINGKIYANVWMTDMIAIILPENGRVTGWINLKGLLKPEERTGVNSVLNGIAYDAVKKRLFVTGKLWPKLFEIEIIPCQTSKEMK